MKIIRYIVASFFELLAIFALVVALIFFFMRNIFAFIAKNIEKFADNTNNIAYWIAKEGGDSIEKKS